MINKQKYNELSFKIDKLIAFLEEHDGINYEVYSFECAASYEEVSVNIIDIALDIKHEIDYLHEYDPDYFPF